MDSPEQIYTHFPHLTALQRERIDQLGALYENLNSQINVISRKDMDFFYERHVLHSMSIALYISAFPGSRWIDIGTGGGFPGIPLAILFPDTQFYLADSVGKKVKVARSVADELGLKNVETLHSRAEDIRDTFDYISGRAVKALPEFIGYTRHLFRKNSLFVYLKGGEFEEELKGLKRVRLEKIGEKIGGEYFETKKLLMAQL
jgi:16S rRNA (guanine527-N7)-methyltransferase